MIKVGKLTFNYIGPYDKWINTLNVVEKVTGDYTEVLINRELYQYSFESGGEWLLDKDEHENDYKVYANMTLDQALSYYKHSANDPYVITWITPLTEV